MTLAEVSARCGIDQPALSRLENGHTQNPTLGHAPAYAAAVGKRLVLSAEDIQHTRPRVTTPNADRRRGQESSGQEEAKGVNQGPLLEVGKG